RSLPSSNRMAAPAGPAHRVCLALARALGEYGSVVFISGNMPFKTEIAPGHGTTRIQDQAGGRPVCLDPCFFRVSSLALCFFLRYTHRCAPSKPRNTRNTRKKNNEHSRPSPVFLLLVWFPC